MQQRSLSVTMSWCIATIWFVNVLKLLIHGNYTYSNGMIWVIEINFEVGNLNWI